MARSVWSMVIAFYPSYAMVSRVEGLGAVESRAAGESGLVCGAACYQYRGDFGNRVSFCIEQARGIRHRKRKGAERSVINFKIANGAPIRRRIFREKNNTLVRGVLF